MKNKTKLAAVAYHEAGHAVAHCCFHVPFRKATIVPSEDYLGMVEGKRLGPKLTERFSIGYPTPRDRDRVESVVMCLFAGTIAEHRFTGRWSHRGARTDDANATDLLLNLAGGNGDEIPLYAKWLRHRASVAILSPVYWPVVEAVAQELLTRKTLTAQQVRLVLGATWDKQIAKRRQQRS
jgi:hypothetical protein